MISPIAWRTPPRHYGPWESVVSNLTECLIEKGIDVTLFATKESITSGKLHAVCDRGYEEDRSINPKVWECLHISEVFEHAEEFDLIHNHFDFLPLTYSGLVSTPMLTTIHGFSSPSILPVYKKYNKGNNYFVAISNADRHPELDYIATIHHGIDAGRFYYNDTGGDYLLFFGRIHPDKGTKEAIEIAQAAGRKLIIAGIVQDEEYFKKHVAPYIDNDKVVYLGSAEPFMRNELLGNAYALLHPINFNEPFGLSVIESMACGTPVIANNRGSMAELIKNGKNGFLVASLNEAIEAVDKIKNIDRMNCRKRVIEHFTVNRMTNDYINIYENIIHKYVPKNISASSQDIMRNVMKDSMSFKETQSRNSY